MLEIPSQRPGSLIRVRDSQIAPKIVLKMSRSSCSMPAYLCLCPRFHIRGQLIDPLLACEAPHDALQPWIAHWADYSTNLHIDISRCDLLYLTRLRQLAGTSSECPESNLRLGRQEPALLLRCQCQSARCSFRGFGTKTAAKPNPATTRGKVSRIYGSVLKFRAGSSKLVEVFSIQLAHWPASFGN